MNIDVREYLRINPISVHELTLSGVGSDCFLVFPRAEYGASFGVGYEVMTQDTLFNLLFKEIFQSLIIEEDGKFQLAVTIENAKSDYPTITWNEGVHLSDTQFMNYYRRVAWESCCQMYAQTLADFETRVDAKLAQLMRIAAMGFPAAVELQSSLLRKIGWVDRTTGLSCQPIYDEFQCNKGQIWCYEQDSDPIEGVDDAVVETLLRHSHPDTKAEAMTQPFTTSFGGGQLIGNYMVGSELIVSYGDNRAPAAGVVLEIMQDSEQGELTYPLWGENVLDWRNRSKTHNNIPPSTNIHMRVCPFVEENAILYSVPASRDGNRQIEDGELEKFSSVAEVKYQSLQVKDLQENYTLRNLSASDCLLRMTLDECVGDDVKLMKQTVQMFLDLFADNVKNTLDVNVKIDDEKDVTDWVFNGEIWVKNILKTIGMSNILRPKLDEELVLKSEFVTWYNDISETLLRIQDKINQIKDLLTSVKPMAYRGKIIISTKDDTEQKVIANYGGKSWRRITNFLRGVGEKDETIGMKLGEEMVCLRESNIPIHTHDMKMLQTDQEDGHDWMEKDRGGRTVKVLNANENMDGGLISGGTMTSKIDYQISPLEYGDATDITIPHDNLPPYREVYIWECVESTADEKAITGEPEFNSCTLVWKPNGGTIEGCEEEETHLTYVIQGSQIGNSPPIIAREGYDFLHWQDRYGKELDPSTKVNEDLVFYAKWEPRDCTITFDANNGTFKDGSSTMTRHVKIGKKIKNFPSVERADMVLNHWYTEPEEGQGERVYQNTIVKGDATYYAHWIAKTKIATVTFDPNGGTGAQVKTLKVGDSVGDLPDGNTVKKEGHDLVKWTLERAGGKEVTPEMQVKKNLICYAQWEANQYRVTFDSNGGMPSTVLRDVTYGSTLGSAVGVNGSPHTGIPTDTGEPPEVEYPVHSLEGWMTSLDPDTAEMISEKTKFKTANNNVVYHAKWGPKRYGISYNMNGRGKVPDEARTWYNVDIVSAQPYYPPNPNDTRGYAFMGWVIDDDGTPRQTYEMGYDYIPSNSIGDRTFTAFWEPVRYNVFWNFNNYMEFPDDNRELDNAGNHVQGTYWTWYTIEDDYTPPSVSSSAGSTGYKYSWTPAKIAKGTIGDLEFSLAVTPEEYTITLVQGDYGTLSTSQLSFKKNYGETLGELPTPGSNNQNMGFAGWWTAPEEDSEAQLADENSIVTGNATYYARWLDNSYATVTLRENLDMEIHYNSYYQYQTINPNN